MAVCSVCDEVIRTYHRDNEIFTCDECKTCKKRIKLECPWKCGFIADKGSKRDVQLLNHIIGQSDTGGPHEGITKKLVEILISKLVIKYNANELEENINKWVNSHWD